MENQTQDTPEEEYGGKLFTVKQFCKKHRFIKPGGIRYQIFNRAENGLGKSGAIVRIGRKVIINEEKYFKWIESLQC